MFKRMRWVSLKLFFETNYKFGVCPVKLLVSEAAKNGDILHETRLVIK